jgi:two-component system response regulator HydG
MVSFITQDPETLELLALARKVAPTDITVLIQGESGTGKELVAQLIHRLSSRFHPRSPLVCINCGAIPETLIVSELFGHEKGAFTSATTTKIGLVEAAHEGTLFLDEIGEMGIEAQAKLLRFLQEGEIYRVGGGQPIKINTRIIAATNKDLGKQVKEGKFREDLFYRINTLTLNIPSLRKRPGDIPLLIQHFLKQAPSAVEKISDEAVRVLMRYHWPGNIRELQNLIERFKILVEGSTIKVSDIPFHCVVANPTDEYRDSWKLDTVEKQHIIRVLSHFKGNKTKAAQAMGITVKTLYNKLSQYSVKRGRSDQTA